MTYLREPTDEERNQSIESAAATNTRNLLTHGNSWIERQNTGQSLFTMTLPVPIPNEVTAIAKAIGLDPLLQDVRDKSSQIDVAPLNESV